MLEFVDGLKIGYSTRCRRFLGGGRDERVHRQDEWTTHKHFHEWERIDELVGELPRPPNRKHAHLDWVLARLHPALRRNVAVPKTAAEVTFNLYEISLWHSEGLEQAQLPPDLWYPQRATRDYPGAHLITHSNFHKPEYLPPRCSEWVTGSGRLISVPSRTIPLFDRRPSLRPNLPFHIAVAWSAGQDWPAR